MSRFLSQHPSPWGWNPFPYCGLPVNFMYVPGVLYVAAVGMRLLPHVAPGTVYRDIVALATCLGPVTLFLFSLHFTRSRRWAFLAALAYTFLSPSYGLFPAVEKDRGIVQLPWRIQVLAKYGEGPHNTALTILPMTLLAVWLAARRRTIGAFVLAAVLLAAIPLTNWVGAFALAISCLLLLLAAWGEPEFKAWRVFAAAALAYLLACFWLTPSFIKIIAFNWPADSFGYQLGPKQLWSLAGMAVGALVIRLLFRLLRGSFYFCLVTLCAFVFGWAATAFYIYGLDTIPESRRYAIEFELFLALALVEALRVAFRHKNQTVRLCAVCSAGVLFLAGLPQLWAYTTQGWQPWLPVAPETTTEHQLARWLSQNAPQGRVFASGGLRFRLNSWFDLQQVGGAFETGLRNRAPVDLSYRIRAAANLRPGREAPEHQAEDTVLELKALSAAYVVAHGPKSREYYRDFIRPERLAIMPVAYRSDDDIIYALPNRGLAHAMRPEEIPHADVRHHRDVLTRYVAAIEDPARPVLNTSWVGTNTLSVAGSIQPGDVLALQVNADPGWRATQDGREIPMTEDSLGFVVLHPSPAAATRILLQYRGTAEQRILGAVSALAWLGCLFACIRRRHA